MRRIPFSLKTVALLIAVLVFFLIYNFIDLELVSTRNMLAVVALMAILWFSEAIPIAATAILPILLFPALSILNVNDTAAAYLNSTIFLFLGGFLLAIAMERTGLHNRVALRIILISGRSPAGVIGGFMASAFVISMWISNTATALILLPMALATIKSLEERFPRAQVSRFSIALLLGVAYSCSIGGVATLIGTPPNLIFLKLYSESFAQLPPVTFANWFSFAFPLAGLVFFFAWLLLTKLLYRVNKDFTINRSQLRQEYRNLGPIRREEIFVLVIFFMTVFLWFFRLDLKIGNTFTLPGWQNLSPFFLYLDDSSVVILTSLLLFILPFKKNSSGSEKILDASSFGQIPWGMVLLFGGGFALAKGFSASKLDAEIAKLFMQMPELPIFFWIFLISLLMTFLSEFTSNTASVQILLPILIAAATAKNLPPLLLLLPATLAASLAFMLPVGTPPNAIVFASEKMEIADMLRAGFILNLFAICISVVYVYLLAPIIF